MILYREPTRQELTLLRRSFNHWGIFDYILDKEILLHEKILKQSMVKEVFLTTKVNSKMTTKNQSLLHIGMLVGHLKRRSFVPSMAGADLIARISDNFPFVRVNQTAEALVLYGRDIMRASIVDYANLKKNNTLLIILNENRIAIGVGMNTITMVKDTRTLEERIVVKTMSDAGHYLRNERLADLEKFE